MFSVMKAMLLVLATLLTASAARADQIDMKNGDRYLGRVLSLDANSVVLENDVLGKVTIPRAKISLLSIGAPTLNLAAPTTTTTNSTPAALAVKSTSLVNNDTDIQAALKQLGANTNFIAKIKGQFLADAGPAANQQFDATLEGLMSGNIDIAALRAQAKSTAAELRKYQHDSPEAGDMMESYLAILDNFVRETDTSTNR
jgi:hypothetical protein